jgi:alanine racemase
VLHEVRVDPAAVTANATALSAAGEFVADLSFDAWGHGLLVCAAAAIDGGASAVAVATDAEETCLRDAGFVAPVLRTGSRAAGLHGLELYGLAGDTRPAMHVTARVLGLKAVQPGDGVSYGYTWHAHRATTLAMLGIGYADGMDRSASNRGAVLLGGERRPIVGRVAMNVVMVDLGDDLVELGDSAVIIGPGQPASVWAASVGRSPLEVVLGFAAKAPR